MKKVLATIAAIGTLFTIAACGRDASPVEKMIVSAVAAPTAMATENAEYTETTTKAASASQAIVVSGTIEVGEVAPKPMATEAPKAAATTEAKPAKAESTPTPDWAGYEDTLEDPADDPDSYENIINNPYVPEEPEATFTYPVGTASPWEIEQENLSDFS